MLHQQTPALNVEKSRGQVHCWSAGPKQYLFLPSPAPNLPFFDSTLLFSSRGLCLFRSSNSTCHQSYRRPCCLADIHMVYGSFSPGLGLRAGSNWYGAFRAHLQCLNERWRGLHQSGEDVLVRMAKLDRDLRIERGEDWGRRRVLRQDAQVNCSLVLLVSS